MEKAKATAFIEQKNSVLDKMPVPKINVKQPPNILLIYVWSSFRTYPEYRKFFLWTQIKKFRIDFKQKGW